MYRKQTKIINSKENKKPTFKSTENAQILVKNPVHFAAKNCEVSFSFSLPARKLY